MVNKHSGFKLTGDINFNGQKPTDGSVITGQTEKTFIVGDDKFLISDSEDSGNLKKIKKSNLGLITAGFVTNLVMNTVGVNNNDVAVELTFLPKLIQLYYYIQGYDHAGGNSYFHQKIGLAYFNSAGTRLSNITLGRHGSITTPSDDDKKIPLITNFTGIGATGFTSNIIAGVSTEFSIKITITIPIISATGFTIRRLTQTGLDSSRNARAKISWIAWG